jgi:uncharacterized protein (TIGR02270 family)
MATSTRAFLIELYEEYLEEASFLYEQRFSLFNNPEISWKKIGEFEERFEAHIDGLVVGEALAVEVCQRRALEGDFGELHVAARVFCRQNKRDLLFAMLEEIDVKDAEKVQAMGDALKYEGPTAWYDDLWLLCRTNRFLIPLLTKIAAYRGAEVRNLERILQETAAEDLADVIWACGRLRQIDVRNQLRTYLEHEDPAVQSAAATALLRLGDIATLDCCLHRLASSSWPAIPLGLAGSRMAVRAFPEESRKDPPTFDQLLAIGLLGQTSLVSFLLRSLGSPESAEAAAIALELITGAHLNETVFVPEPLDEDELFAEERESLGANQGPRRPDGRPFGTNVTRLSQKPEDWQLWWSERGDDFNPELRYRYGRPYSHSVLVDVLKSGQSPHLIRRLAHEELVIRYGADVRFETDMFVRQQEQGIAMLQVWAERNLNRFREGCFYFAGSLQHS